MDIFEGRYYVVSKWFLEFLGLWPYQTNLRRNLSLIVFAAMNLSVVLPQILILVEQKGSNFNILIENSLSILFTIACFIKYAVTFISAPRLKMLLSQIAKDWQRLSDEHEIEILCRYGEEGRNLVMFYTVYVFVAWVLYNFLPFIPPLMDILIPLENDTHALVYPFYADYVFFKQEDYHYEACLHVFFVYFATTSLFAGSDTIYVATVKHSCALFEITCHRLENMGKSVSKGKDTNEIEPDDVVHRDLKRAIIMHNDTMSCVDLLEDSFSLCFLLIQGMVVVGIATLCFYMMRIYEQTFNMVRFSSFTFGLVIHIFYLNWVGQQIIDSSDQVFFSVYCSDWYLISTKARQMTKIIMVRSLFPCHLTAGKIIILSMETFGALMKTSISYFTVLLSVA